MTIDSNQRRLSICIATLNRATFISATLESIIHQMTNRVEIVVLDGASTDATESVMRDIEKNCPHLRYIRLTENHGLDRDYNSAAEACTGDYVWLMTDDDLLMPGALDRVLRALDDAPSLVVVNAEIRNADMSRVLQARRMSINADRWYTATDWDDFLAASGDYLSFIGCVVIKRSIWIEREKAPYFGTLFIHVGVIFQGPLPGRAMLIADPFISIRYGNAMWRPRQFEIWMFKWPNLIWSFPHLSDYAKASVCDREPWRDWKVLLLHRAKGSYALEEYRKWIAPRTQGSWNGRMAALIARVPGGLANTIAIFYGHLTRQGTRTGLIDLKASRYYFRNWFGSAR